MSKDAAVLLALMIFVFGLLGGVLDYRTYHYFFGRYLSLREGRNIAKILVFIAMLIWAIVEHIKTGKPPVHLYVVGITGPLGYYAGLWIADRHR